MDSIKLLQHKMPAIIAALGIALFLTGCFLFKKEVKLPTLVTVAVSEISENTATSGGNITADGGAEILSRGVVWNTTQNPAYENNLGHTSDGPGTGEFISTISGLTSNTTYYVRAYATNSQGTAYGQQESFTTAQAATQGCIDADGNVYATVDIGGQIWMAENLRTTKYNDGSAIPTGHDITAWAALTTGAYAVYPHSVLDGLNSPSDVMAVYGALYNWYAVDTRKLCPSGWRVPHDVDWQMLTDFLGGMSVAGGKMKEAGLAHWIGPNNEATNESGFTALAAGRLAYNSGFDLIGRNAFFWFSIQLTESEALQYGLQYLHGQVTESSSHKAFGYSVRCVEDLPM